MWQLNTLKKFTSYRRIFQKSVGTADLSCKIIMMLCQKCIYQLVQRVLIVCLSRCAVNGTKGEQLDCVVLAKHNKFINFTGQLINQKQSVAERTGPNSLRVAAKSLIWCTVSAKAICVHLIGRERFARPVQCKCRRPPQGLVAGGDLE